MILEVFCPNVFLLIQYQGLSNRLQYSTHGSYKVCDEDWELTHKVRLRSTIWTCCHDNRFQSKLLNDDMTNKALQLVHTVPFAVHSNNT